MAKSRWSKDTFSARWHDFLKNAAARRKPKAKGRVHIVPTTVIKQHIYGANCPLCRTTNKFMPSGNLIEWCEHIGEASIASVMFFEP